MGEITGTAGQKQPIQLQPIDLDAENSRRKQTDDDVEKLLTNPQADRKQIFLKLWGRLIGLRT